MVPYRWKEEPVRSGAVPEGPSGGVALPAARRAVGETWEWGDVGEGIGGEQWRRVEDAWDGVFEIFLRLLELHVAF